jgi:hypothetical protein
VRAHADRLFERLQPLQQAVDSSDLAKAAVQYEVLLASN